MRDAGFFLAQRAAQRAAMSASKVGLAMPPAAAEGPSANLSRRARAGVMLFLLAVASTQWLGYRFGGSNHSIQVPILKHYADASLYRDDLLMRSVDGYATYFFPALAPLVRVAGGPELPYFVLYVAFHLAALAAVHALAFHAFGAGPVSWVACLVYLANPLSVAGEASLVTRMQHGQLAAAILLWALWLHLRGRRAAALGLCGLTFNIHALYALYVAALLATDNLLSWREYGLRRVIAGLGLCAVAGIPGLVWILGRSDFIPPESRELWLQILRDRSELHVFPLTQPAALYGSYALLVALGVLALADCCPCAFRRTTARFLIAVAGLCAAGFVFAEWFPVTLVLKAQLLRSTKWATYLFIAPLARLLVVSWARGLWNRVAAGVCCYGLLFQQPALLGASLLLYLLVGMRRWSAPVLTAGAAALVAATASGAMALPSGQDADIAGFVADALADRRIAACLGFAVLVRAAAGRAWERSAAALSVAVAGLWALPSVYAQGRASMHAEPWNRVQVWVRDHTPKDAVILTPPYREGFRVFSERAVVGEWKDGTQQFFDAGFAFEWHRRMMQLGGSTRRYDRFDTDTLLSVARQYGASYAVLKPRRKRLLPKVFENEVAAVYLLSPGAALESKAAGR